MSRPANPTEVIVLRAIVSKLEAATGDSYHYDADAAYLVDGLTIKLLAECADEKTLYFVDPGMNTVTPDTGCKRLYAADCIVSGCQRYGAPELPWVTGHVAPAEVKLRMWDDILTALDNKQVQTRDGDSIPLFVADRNLSIREVDGWCIVQAQVRFEYSEVYP